LQSERFCTSVSGSVRLIDTIGSCYNYTVYLKTAVLSCEDCCTQLYISWSPVQCDGCAWRPSQSFEVLEDISVRYSRRSPRLWINKRFLCFESTKVTAEVNSMIDQW